MKRIVVVTGASSGMGKCMAEKFASMGDAVVMTDISGERLEKAAAEVSAKGEVFQLVSDVASEQSVKKLAETVREKFGTCHVLINCAGIFSGGLLHTTTDEEFDKIFAVNIKGTYHTMKHLIPLMMENGTGENAIVNISSLSGVNGDYNAPLYCATKAAVLGISKACALDYAEKGIRINTISPSVTATPMFYNGSSEEIINAFKKALPDHRIGQPEEIAEVAWFLCSQAATHLVGNNITMDGGLSAWNGQPKQNKEEFLASKG